MTLGHMGFPPRTICPDDPLICVCAATIGTQRLLDPGNERALGEARARHAPECARRLEHQQLHRRDRDPQLCGGCVEGQLTAAGHYHVDDGSPCTRATPNVGVDTGWTCTGTAGRWVAERTEMTDEPPF